MKKNINVVLVLVLVLSLLLLPASGAVNADSAPVPPKPGLADGT